VSVSPRNAPDKASSSPGPNGRKEGTPSHKLLAAFKRIRKTTELLATPLSEADCTAQSMPDASPVKWHLAHTTWFFETFVLETLAGFAPFDAHYRVLFNSYYESVGPQHHRPSRGLITRPGLNEILNYRAHVDERLEHHLGTGALDDKTRAVVEVGLHHEQQHQELILTDVKHLLAQNPLQPAYRRSPQSQQLIQPLSQDASTSASCESVSYVAFPGGLQEIGHKGLGFSYDNERPRHQTYVPPFSLATRPVTCGQWFAFMRDGGYQRPELWLSEGWKTVCAKGWQAPLYWQWTNATDGAPAAPNGSGEQMAEVEFEALSLFTLQGLRRLSADEPVSHISFFEAEAFARWAGARLPRENEWEVAAVAALAQAASAEAFSDPQASPAEQRSLHQDVADLFLEDSFGNAVGGVASAPLNLLPGDPGSAALHPRPQKNAGASGFAQASRGSGGSGARPAPSRARRAAPEPGDLKQLFGDVWEWTASPYSPYPGFRELQGALGEYNGKFMCNQFVLRGGSCATPHDHIRATYRNFFPPDARWQFSGLRLARDGGFLP